MWKLINVLYCKLLISKGIIKKLLLFFNLIFGIIYQKNIDNSKYRHHIFGIIYQKNIDNSKYKFNYLQPNFPIQTPPKKIIKRIPRGWSP